MAFLDLPWLSVCLSGEGFPISTPAPYYFGYSPLSSKLWWGGGGEVVRRAHMQTYHKVTGQASNEILRLEEIKYEGQLATGSAEQTGYPING